MARMSRRTAISLALLVLFVALAAFFLLREERAEPVLPDQPDQPEEIVIDFPGPPELPDPASDGPSEYDIAYVRMPRYGDDGRTYWPEVFHPTRHEPGADLMLLHPDGSEELLVEGGDGSVTDPYVSLDGEWVYYSYFWDLRPERLRQHLPLAGADVFRIHLPSRRVEQLTFGEFTPNTGAGRWDVTNPVDPGPEYNALGHGVFNTGPCPLPGGRIAFTSNRNGFEPPKGYTTTTMQLFVMDEDGSNVTPIAPMSLSSALHPTILRDGRIMFGSHENQGLRDRRNWGLWHIAPDGRYWGPLVSAFREAQAFHFMTQLSNGDIAFVDYYNLNNSGFGAIYRFPLPVPGEAAFHPASLDENPRIARTKTTGFEDPFRMPFTPKGLISITPMTHSDDAPAPPGPDGRRVGKFTHPSGAPRGDLLVAYTPGPAHHRNQKVELPAYDSGIYIVPGGQPVAEPSQLVEIKNDPAYNEAWPRAVVPYRAIYGIEQPEELPWLPNDGTLHAELPAGTPHGLIGTSSFYRRGTFPGNDRVKTFDGLEPFNTAANGRNTNWFVQGADVGLYDDEEIWAVRLVAMEPNTLRETGPGAGEHYFNHAGERLRILGEIPLRKPDDSGGEILDPEGNPDTSFLAKIPADTPFTFQTLDRRGMALNVSQTWHQVRPGELRADCGGCHAHGQKPLAFEGTAASKPEYEVLDLSVTTPLVVAGETPDQPRLEMRPEPLVNVEFYEDIRPILERSCVSCHSGGVADPPAKLVLDDQALYGREEPLLPGDYKRLADDRFAEWGHKPIIRGQKWRQSNASRYVRKFQSRRSLLVWKVFGERLDGWNNGDHPTERVAGDPSTLPGGADPNAADLDFDGKICPPPGTAPALTDEEKRTIARWIDLGAPIDSGRESGNERYGFYLDDLRPTLTVTLPRPGAASGPLERIHFAAADAYSGLDEESLSVIASFPLAGRPPGEELAGLFQRVGEGVWELDLDEPVVEEDPALLVVSVRDRQGNTTRVERSFTAR
jgi:hypothetical protein